MKISKKEKKVLYRIIATTALFAGLLVLDKTGCLDSLPKPVVFILYLIPYLLIGHDVLDRAYRNIRHGNVFDENFLMMIATFGAFGIGEYSEALAVMLFYQIGEWFQRYAVGKSRQSITELMEIAPEYANIEKDGVLMQVDPEELEIGDEIIVKAGEKIPADGVVLEGDSFLDTAALTGESVPRRVRAGEEIISGCINQGGVLKIRVSKKYEDSTVARILELVENASSKKTRLENFITRFARYYTPVVTIAAVCLGIGMPLILGGGSAVWASWIRRACIFLIVSCPCALVISVPLGFFGGIGAASKHGILVKGSNFLEAVSEVDTVVFDKTGTLTKGEFKVQEILPASSSVPEEELLSAAARCEAFSNHPIAAAVRECYRERTGQDVITEGLSDADEIAGRGICLRDAGHVWYAGNRRLMSEQGIEAPESSEAATAVYIAKDSEYLGLILISDTVKEEAKDSLQRLKATGISRTVMLTGDHQKVAEAAAAQLGIDEVRAELLPAGKVEALEEIMAAQDEAGNTGKTAFVGDGINDAPVLMRADVGIAMGSLGSDAAIEAADIVLMDDSIRKIAVVREIAGKTMRIVRQNIVLALCVKALVLILGVLGMANMWEAVFADVGVAVISILNSMRTLTYREY